MQKWDDEILRTLVQEISPDSYNLDINLKIKVKFVLN